MSWELLDELDILSFGGGAGSNPFPNSAFNIDGTTNCSGIAYCNQIPVC